VQVHDCSQELVGLESLRNVSHISLSVSGEIDCSIFSNSKSLAIVDCNEELDVAPLHSVSRLELNYCPRIKNLVALKTVEHFTYWGPIEPECYLDPSFTGFFLSEDHSHKSLRINRDIYQCYGEKFLQNVKNINIIDGMGIYGDEPISVCELTNVISLELSSGLRFDQEEISLLKNLQRIIIFNCDSLCDVNGFDGIHSVEISNCDYLTDITGFGGKNHTIRLEACEAVDDFHSLCDIPYVTLLNCFKPYKDISYLSTVPRLRVVCIDELESSEEYQELKQSRRNSDC
jgi:hypothetical protein